MRFATWCLLAGLLCSVARANYNLSKVGEIETSLPQIETPSMVVDGNYLGVMEQGTQVFNLSNPEVPAALGSPYPGVNTFSIAINSDKFYLGDFDHGKTYIYSLPSLALLGYVPGCMRAMQVRGTTLYGMSQYVTGSFTSDCYLQAWDVSNPATPVAKDKIMTQGDYAFNLLGVDGATALVAAGHDMLQVDVANPAAISIVNDHPLDNPIALVSLGNHRYMAATQWANSFNSTTREPSVGRWLFLNDTQIETPRRLKYPRAKIRAMTKIDANTIALCTSSAVEVYQLSNNDQTITQTASYGIGGPWAIVAKGEYLYVQANPRTVVLRYTGAPFSALSDNSSVQNATIPTSVPPGQTVNAQITVTNSGTSNWYEWDYALAIIDDPQHLFAGTPRVALPHGTKVLPGQSYTFTVPLTNTATPLKAGLGVVNKGTATIKFQMVHENQTFFGPVIQGTVMTANGAQADWSAYD